MALRDPVESDAVNVHISSTATSMMQYAIETGNKLDVHERNADDKKVLEKSKNLQVKDDKLKAEAIFSELPDFQKRVLKRIVDGKAFYLA